MEHEEEIVQEVNNEIPMDEVPIGEDVPQVDAKPVLIEQYRIEPVTKDGKKIGDKLVLITRHPDIDNDIEISKTKFLKGEKIKEAGLWAYLDKDNKIPFNSALASTMRHYTIPYIKDFIGKKVETVLDNNGYLAVKSY